MMSVISGFENSTVTSILPRTGTDGKGRPVYGDDLLAGKTPIKCRTTPPNYLQQKTAQNESISVTAVLTFGKLKNIKFKIGDKLKCDWVDFSGDSELIVNKRETVSNEPGMECTRLYVDYV